MHSCRGSYSTSAPLRTRSWCLFELLQTRYAPKARASHEGLLLCTPTGVLQWGHAHVDTVVRLAEKVGDIRLEDAQASRVEVRTWSQPLGRDGRTRS